MRFMQNESNQYGAPGSGQPQQPVGQPAGAPAGGYGPPPGVPAGVPGPGGFPPPPDGPGGPAGIPPAPGKPFEIKRRKFSWLRFAIPIVVIVLGAVGYFGIFDSDTDRASAGDCLNVKEFKNHEEPGKVDCGDPSANVKIGVRLDSDTDSCPTGDYDEYSVSGSRSYKLCLMLNAREGECWANVTSATDGYKRVDCADPTAEVRIVKVVTGQAEESACGGTEYDVAVTYSQPATTLCASASKSNT